MDFRPLPSYCRRKVSTDARSTSRSPTAPWNHFAFPDGTVESYPLESTRTFEQGKKTIFNITVKRIAVGTTEVEVTATIESWGLQGEVNDDIYIQ